MVNSSYNKLSQLFLAQALQNFAAFVAKKHGIEEEEMNDTISEFISSGNTNSAVKKGKAKKDPNAPKAASSAYIFFTLDQREKIKKDNPDFSPQEIMSEMGKVWKSLSEKEKKPYVEKAGKDKQRFLKEREML